MKKLTSIVIIAALLCVLTACAGGISDADAGDVGTGIGSQYESTAGEADSDGETGTENDSGQVTVDVKTDDLSGPWHLDSYRNDLSGFAGMFECYAEFGASMEIRGDGQMSWYIGAEGGEGTYSVSGSLLTASLTRTADESSMTTEFDILRDGDEIYLGMHWTNGIVFWSWGEDGSAGLAGDDASLNPGENVVELVNLRGDKTTVYKLDDGRYMDREGIVYIFDGAETWTDENGAEWNEIVR